MHTRWLALAHLYVRGGFDGGVILSSKIGKGLDRKSSGILPVVGTVKLSVLRFGIYNI